MNLLPFFKKLFDKVPFLAGLSFSTQLSFLVLVLLFLSIPVTVFSVRAIKDLRSRAATSDCSVTVSWPPNQNRPTDCSKSLTVNWSSPGFAVALAQGGQLVGAKAGISGTSTTFSSLTANTSYHYVVCSPDCGTGRKIKEGDATSSSSGSLVVSWHYTAALTEKGCYSCYVGGSPKTTSSTSITFSSLKPDHEYDYYVCTENCGSGKLVTSGNKRTDPCPITYKAKLTAQGNASNVVAQSGTLPESQTTTKFSNSSIAANTTYDFYVYSPATSGSVYHQDTATSDSACAAQNPPGPPALIRPKGEGDFASPTFLWSSVSGASYYKVLVRPDDANHDNFNQGGFWYKQTIGTSLAWSSASGWSTQGSVGSPPSTFSAGSTYWWMAWSCNNATGGCSLSGAASPVSFKVSGGGPQPQPPGPPTLLQPKGEGDFANPPFSWSSVSGASYYKVLVKPNDNNFSGGGFWWKQSISASLPWSNGSGWNSNGAGAPPSAFSPGTTYWWMAWSCNDTAGGCSLSGAATPVSFAVSGGGPIETKPVIIEPKGDVPGGNPAFRWRQASGITVIKYSLWLRQGDGNFGAGNFWVKDVQLSSCPSSECSTTLGGQWKWVTSGSQTISNPPSPLPSGGWSWLVIACKTNTCAFSDQAPSDIASFNVPGGAAKLPATSLTQTVGTCKSDRKVDVTFHWVPSTSSGVTEQWVDLSLNNNFNSFLNAGPLAPGVKSYSWSDLAGGVAHYWRVNTKFNNGEWKLSGVASFTTPSCEPAQPKPILNSAVICDGGVNKIEYAVQIFDNIETLLIVSDESDLNPARASVRIKPPGDVYKFVPPHAGTWYAQLNRYAFIAGTKRTNEVKTLSCRQPAEVKPPSNIKVLERSCNQNNDFTTVKIGWTNNDPRATSFHATLYKGSDIIFHDQVVNNPWISLTNLNANTNYTITVSADAGGARSAATSPVTFQAPPCPGRFDTIKVDTVCTADNKVEATFYWNPSAGAQGYIVDLSTVGPPNTWNGLNKTFINNAKDPNRILLATSYVWEGLRPSAKHYWRVYAYNGEFGRHAYGPDFAKSCGGFVPNDKQVLKDMMHSYIVEKRPTRDYKENRNVTEAERNTFAGKMFNVMIQESFGVDFPSTAYNASGNWHGIFQYLPGTWSRQYSQPAVGSNIWYKPAVDSGAPNRPPDVRDGIKDGDIYNPYAQVERTVWTWNGGETGKYQVGEWGPYNIWFGSESPFVCNVYPAKCAL